MKEPNTSYLQTNDKSQCCGCRACEQACSAHCIEMKDEYGYIYPHIDKSRCIECGKCVRACQYTKPGHNRHEDLLSRQVFACWSMSDDLVLKSSSGGIFMTIAREIINAKGVVFGARYEDGFKVSIDDAEDLESCKAFMGSKYVFSNTQNAYTRVKEYLKRDFLVFYTGTPCQVSGLLSYLGSDHPKLLTMDLVCHSVVAPVVLTEYLREMEIRYGAKVSNVNFRYKSDGQWAPKLKIDFENDACHLKSFYDDTYSAMFGSCISAMKSCSSCPYANNARVGDITAGDFWGIEKSRIEAYHEKGTSLVLVNTEKGRVMFEQIRPKLKVFDSTLEAMKDNLSLFRPCGYNPLSQRFLKSVAETGFAKPFRRYVTLGNKLILPYRLLRKIKRMLFN